MAAKNLELRQKISGSFNNTNSQILIKSHWDTLEGKPSDYVPTPHTHTIANITNLQTELTDRIKYNDTAGHLNMLNKGIYNVSGLSKEYEQNNAIKFNTKNLEFRANGRDMLVMDGETTTSEIRLVNSVLVGNVVGNVVGSASQLGGQLPAYYAKVTDLASYVPTIRKVAGLVLSSDISAASMTAAINEATTSLKGLMSPTDKTNLNTLVALLATGDANTVVDTITEVLAIFNNYPEGADLVTALAGKLGVNATAKDSDKLGGLQLHAGVNNEANKIVRTDGSGYVKFGWINTASGETAGTSSHYFVNTANDGYIRKKTLANVQTEIVTKAAVDAVVTHQSLSAYLTSALATSTYEPKITKGTSAQYFKGDMSLATFPTIPTIPSIMDTTEGQNGTVITARTINASNLKAIILNHSPAGNRNAADVYTWAKKSSLAPTDIPYAGENTRGAVRIKVQNGIMTIYTSD